MPVYASAVHRQHALLGLFVALCAGCARHEPPGLAGDEEPSSSVTVVAPGAAPVKAPAPSASASAPRPSPPAEGELPIGPEYEAQPDEGPLVAAVARPVWIFEGPEFSFRRVGYLHPGMTLRRAEKPVATGRRCKGGWYRVAPRGFLCLNGEVTSDLSNPVVAAYAHQARRGEPLPYVYGRVQSHLAFRYAKAPTLREQHETEGEGLDEHLSRISRLNQMTVTGPPEPLPPFLGANQILPKAQNVTHRARHGAHRGVGGGRSSFAFLGVYDVSNRLFGLSTDLDLVPLDRLKLATVTKIHGGAIDDLPAAVTLRPFTPRMRLDGDRFVQDGTLDAYETLSLTGQTRDDMHETRDGFWVFGKSVYPFRKRTSWPGFLKDGDTMKWIDVSLRDQTLVAYEGHRAVFATRVSTGAGGEGDPETTHATVKGMYRVQAKHVTATMSGDRTEGNDYELADVPYVQYFHHDYALHAAYWHEGFGTPRSHGCVNLTPRDAAWVFDWTDPKLPAEWHGLEANGEGTLVFIH